MVILETLIGRPLSEVKKQLNDCGLSYFSVMTVGQSRHYVTSKKNNYVVRARETVDGSIELTVCPLQIYSTEVNEAIQELYGEELTVCE